MKPILIMAAVPRELELLVNTLQDPYCDTDATFSATEGNIGATRLVCCAGGVGKANAASAATSLVERYRPELIIITGCGGAYPGSGLSVGDLALASDEIFGDEGVDTPTGWLDLGQMELPLLTKGVRSWYNSIPLARHEAQKAMKLAGSHGIQLVRGRFVTVSSCSGTKGRGQELARRYQAVCENMEGASIALTALRYGIPCLEIRGISNLVEDRDMSRWDISRAVEAAQRFVIKIVEEVSR
ncbi:futalosine hydrolase [Trichlorobacter thiogenes]|uniref:Futalosine hydrolase n=1 Tax=Trichlorobacter thiogenes TaxID=115783 RepID=A0A1T4RFZ5_9BACT|nr:futalosine hydrolase [Trichlorobacter thiogenes]SKA14905.1 futalosine hydrolase [Trichlorobacter thiogenes]